VRALLANRDARWYLGGQTLSIVGDNALWLAMAVWVKILTGSNSAAGLVFFAFSGGILLAPVTGLVADRLRRRPVLIAANLAAAALVCALLAVRGHGQVWLIYPVMFGYGALNSLITSAQTALLAVMLPSDLLGEANSVLQMAAMGLRVISPLLGAGLLAWAGPVPVVLLDVGTFVIAAGTVAMLRVREPAPAPAATSWRAEITAGVRYIGGTPALRRLLIAGVIAVLVFGFFETVPFAVIGQGLHRGPAFLGVLEAVMGVGALAGGAFAAPAMRRAGERAVVALGLLGCAGSCLLLIPPWLPAVLVGMGVLGLSIVWINVGAITLIQRRTPADLLGRVDATLDVALTVPQTASIALGAALIAVVDYRILLVVMTVVVAASAVYLAAEPASGKDRAAPVTGETGPAVAGAVGAGQAPPPETGGYGGRGAHE
jgi:Na+/melibiose symporter-like transporter